MKTTARRPISILALLVSGLTLSLAAGAEEIKAPADQASAKPAAKAEAAAPAAVAPKAPAKTPAAPVAAAEAPRPRPVATPGPRRIVPLAEPVRVAPAARVTPKAAPPVPVVPVLAAPPAEAAHDTHAGHAPHWSYEGDNGPHAWAKLAPEFAACGSGQRQSPIDIRDGMKLDLDPVVFEYRPSSFRVLDNGHTIQANVSGWNSIRVMGRTFRLEQFHFHRPSEETIDGKQFEMVVHLVHKDSQGRLAVVAVLVEVGARQPVIQAVLNNLPLEKGEELKATSSLDLSQLLPADRRYFTYMGSLTTPPCTEDVLWIVLKKPVQATLQQIELFSRMYPMNARPVQSGMDRMIKESN